MITLAHLGKLACTLPVTLAHRTQELFKAWEIKHSGNLTRIVYCI